MYVYIYIRLHICIYIYICVHDCIRKHPKTAAAHRQREAPDAQRREARAPQLPAALLVAAPKLWPHTERRPQPC